MSNHRILSIQSHVVSGCKLYGLWLGLDFFLVWHCTPVPYFSVVHSLLVESASFRVSLLATETKTHTRNIDRRRQ